MANMIFLWRLCDLWSCENCLYVSVTAYEAKPDAIPYAGYFIKTRQNSQYDLQFAKKILESNQFYEYVKNVGTPTTTTSYRVSVKEIEDFTFIN